MIEKLTEEERSDVEEIASCQSTHVESYQANARRSAALQKALRILDAQAVRIEELETKHTKARQRITELEAQVTASETVSRAEYDAMVKQRDTLRQERNTAINERDTERIRVNALCEALEVAREALHDAMGDIGDALGLSEEEPQ